MTCLLPTVPPKVTPISFPRDLNVGDRTSVQCVVTSGDLPLSFAWLKDGALVPADGQAGLGDVSVRQSDDFSSALSIGTIATEHSGNYTCRVSNQASTVTVSAALQVNGKWGPTRAWRSVVGSGLASSVRAFEHRCLVQPVLGPLRPHTYDSEVHDAGSPFLLTVPRPRPFVHVDITGITYLYFS